MGTKFYLGIIAFFISLLVCNVFQKNKGEYLNEVNYVGTIRIVMSFRNGLVIAADGKGSVINLDNLTNSDYKKLDRMLLYHQKLFKLGINLVAGYGGQWIKTKDYFLPYEGFNQEFMNSYSFDANETLEINEIADRLFENLRFRYYSQPIENQIRESSIILAGFDENAPKVCLIIVNDKSQRIGQHKDYIEVYDNFTNLLKFGPHWRKVEDNSSEISERFHSIKFKIDRIDFKSINREEAIYFAKTMIEECIRIETALKDKLRMKIDFPIHYCVIEKNKPIEIIEILQ